MFTKWLRTLPLRVASGMARARPRAAGARSPASGCARRVNGRNFVRTIGVASRANGLTCALTFCRSRTAGRRGRGVGATRGGGGRRAELGGERRRRPQRPRRLLERRRQLGDRSAEVAVLGCERVQRR